MMKICVQSLDAYNQGKLIYEWLAPLDYSEEDFLKKVEEATKGADEVMVADYDNAPNCGEYPNLRHYWQLCHEIRLARHSVNTDDLIAYVREEYITPDIDTYYRALDMFENGEVMRYESVDDFVEQNAVMMGIEQLPKHWVNHIDMESYRADLEHEYSFTNVNDGVLVALR
jgi:antirestriction protein